jgi:hypothetical protein
LQLNLGIGVDAFFGYPAIDVGDALEQADILGRQNRPSQPAFTVIWSLIRLQGGASGRPWGERPRKRNAGGSRCGKSEILSIEVYFVVGASLFWFARFSESLEHLTFQIYRL